MVFVFKQKTAYEMRISDWSSDVCSSNLPSGVIQGFDAVTGKLRWAWDMTHPDWNGAPPEGQTWTRGTPNMWTIAAGDEQLGYVYLPMGNATADYWSSSRTAAENQYATSLEIGRAHVCTPVTNAHLVCRLML